MSEIIGITGTIGSGKTTLAEFLTELEPSHAVYECWQVIAEVADDFNKALAGELAFTTNIDNAALINQALIWLTEAIQEHLHHDINWNHIALTKQQLAAQPELFDKLFIYLEAAKAEPSLLANRITAENKETYRPLLQWLGGYLVTKVSKTVWFDEIFRRARRDNDKNLIIITGLRYPSDAEIVRRHGGKIIEVSRPLVSHDEDDVTEASRHLIEADIHLDNNGNLSQLRNAAEKLWYDLSVSKSRSEYNSN